MTSRSQGAVLDVARSIGATSAGRFLLVSLPLAIVAGLLWRERLVWWLGLGLVPLGAWAGACLYLAVSAPLRLIRFWRVIVGALVTAIALTGLLGMFTQPVDTVLGQVTSGGNLGRLIARAPFEWPIVEPGPFELLLASLRIAGVATVAAAIFLPRHALISARVAGRFAGLLASWTASGVEFVRARLADRAEARRLRQAGREAARLAALAAVETEASMLEDPPTAVAKPKARRLFGRREPAEAVSASGVDGATPADDGAELAEDAGEGGAASAGQLPSSAGGIATGTGAPPAQGAGRAASPSAGGQADGAGTSAAHAAVATAVPAPRPPVPNYSWKLPSLDLLKVGKQTSIPQSEIEATSDLIVDTLAEHGVEVKISQVTAGPTVTMYGIAPGWERARHKAGRNDRWEDEDVNRKRVRVDTILAREKDLALALASPNLRFEAPIPGESLVGIEVPNAHPSIVTLRSAMQSDAFREFERKAALPVTLGIASSSGEVLADLTKMPHLLVAGATGSGKSVCMNTIITGFLLTRTPAQVQLILIDPKRVELTPYAGVPHLAVPPVVEADRAVLVLRALVKEMMARYAILQSAGAKNIAAYNERAGAYRLPYLVVAIDELADLMLTSANDVERLIVRLAQLGRATGVHLIVATQRPSVDVVTGLIKANFPSRIAFAVSSQVDSRTILDSNGAERLLGRGDMLFLPIDRPKPMRVQGAFLTDGEVESVVRVWRSSGGPRLPELHVEEPQPEVEVDDERGGSDDESLFVRAQELARSQAKLSTSLLQRRLRIGYPRAARLMDELEDAGIVGAGEPGKPRQVLIHQ